MQANRNFSLLALGVLLGGCAAAPRHGDVRVTHVGPQIQDTFTFTIRDEGTAVAFPAVALSRPGTTEFRVDALPPGDYRYRFYLTGDHAHRLLPPSRREPGTRISLRATAPDGTTLLQTRLRFGDLPWYRDGSKWYVQIDLPDLRAADYRLRVTVDQPSPAADATLHLRGFAPD